jgi:hypothetical protein
VEVAWPFPCRRSDPVVEPGGLALVLGPEQAIERVVEHGGGNAGDVSEGDSDQIGQPCVELVSFLVHVLPLAVCGAPIRYLPLCPVGEPGRIGPRPLAVHVHKHRLSDRASAYLCR